LDQVFAAVGAPKEVAQSVERQRRLAAARKQRDRLSHLFNSTTPDEERRVFDGTRCFIWDPSHREMVAIPPEEYRSPVMYLAGQGLRPLDVHSSVAWRQYEKQFWFPDNFELYETIVILPYTEEVAGCPCMVVLAERHADTSGKRSLVSEKFWFDPSLGFAPRKWEHGVDGHVESVRMNTDFEEFAPGCWLPWESVMTYHPPAWVGPEMAGRPAYSYHMRLRKAQVRNVSDNLFRP
jgi:hypothetical protein